MQNNKKLKGGTLWDIKKFSKKVAVPKKNQKGDPLVSAGFVGYVKKVKNERRDPLETEKISKKSRTAPKKNRKGGLFSPVRFCRLPSKSKKRKGGPFALFALAP